ncbi:MAG: class I SAM-dependent methyltransferase [Bdellovibrionota bacterium]|nr:class I SAM-dependent methyltransferase [Bdellovibrionota bacterium]
MSLEKDYFDKIYAKSELIDGDYNAKSHARYLFQILSLVEANVSSVADFGFGKGKLLYETLKLFRPSRVMALDSSEYAFNELQKQKWVKDWNIDLQHKELSQIVPPKKAFDLGICNSVLQYVQDEDLEQIFERLSYSCRFIYLHVPSREDYQKLKLQSDFKDPWAKKRPDRIYQDLVARYFTRVSWGLLESKTLVDAELSPFFDSLYRS